VKLVVMLCLILVVFSPTLNAQIAENPINFTEVWAYLMRGEEMYLSESHPISDIGYFGAGITMFGKLTGVPDRGKLRDFKGRVHLVVAETANAPLTHFCLDPQYGLRDTLIEEIATASSAFDGVQIDFEAVPGQDKALFADFLATLKARLGDKTLSVALPARWKTVNDSYDYALIGEIVDRIVVMAYDEHWSTSVPGPIASIEWCKNVSKYAMEKIGNAKLIMGTPFYGRAWIDKNPARAYKHSGVASLLAEKGSASVNRDKEIPFFDYEETVNVRVFYEDARSISFRLKVYESAAVDKIAFWRLGQEDNDVWNYLRTLD
jgi:spore germination protein YaaH